MPDIRISAAPDVSSFRSVDNLLKGLIVTVDRLNKSMENLGRSVSKIQTGGIQQGNVSAIKTQKQNNSGGIGGAILGDTSDVQQRVNKVLAAIESLDRGVKTKAGSISQSVSSISSSLRSVGGGGDNSELFARNGAIGAPHLGAGGRAPSGAVFNPIVPSMNPPSPPRGGSGGGGVIGISGMGIVGGAEALMAGNVSGFLGSTLGRLGIAGGIAYGAYRLADAGTSYVNNARGANLNYQIQYPLAQEQAVGSAMAPFKQMGRDAMSWNILGMSGMRAAVGTAAYAAAIDPAKREGLIQTKLKEMTLSGALGNLMQDTLDPVAAQLGKGRSGKAGTVSTPINQGVRMGGFGTYVAPVPSVVDQEMLGRHKMARNMAEAEVASDISSGIMSVKDAVIRQKTSLDEYYENAYSGGGALSRVKTMRSFGRSTAPIKFKDGTQAVAYEWLQAQALSQGRDFGDMAQEYHQVDLGIGKGFRKVFGGFGAVSAGEAGFGNITQIAKIAGMLTGGVGGADTIVDNIQGMTNGKNGIDVAVSRDLFQNLSQSALSSGMSGASSFNQVNRMVGTYVGAGGSNVAIQHRNAYAYGLGNQLEQTYTSGSRSGFDKASSWQDSIYGTGGVFDASTIRLQEMGATDPRLMAAIAYGGAKVPTWAEGLIDRTSARGYLESSRKRPFATVVDELWANKPKQAAILSKIREGGGDPNSFFESRLSGLKAGSTEWFDAEWKAAQEAGGILGGNKMANAAMLSEQYLRTKTLDAPTGPGAHSPGAADYEDIVLKNASAYQKEVARAGKAKGGPLSDKEKDAIAQKLNLTDHLRAEQALRGVGTDIPALSDAFVKAASELANAIKNKAAKNPVTAKSPGA
jgi:hypothetical protein